MRDASSVMRNTLASQAYETVKGQILDQRMLPGDKVTIDHVARSLGCSSASVREALTRLHAERLLEFAPYRGYVVTNLLSPNSFRNLYEVREMIELKAIEGAVLQIDKHAIREITDMLRVTIDGNADPVYQSYQAFLSVDQAFHRKLLELSGNPYLVELWDGLYVHLHLARFYRIMGYVDFTDGQREHESIIHALAQRDVESARTALRQHLTGSFERLFPGGTCEVTVSGR